MSRTVIDIDDKLLAEAAGILGTDKKVATVNAALADVVNRRKRQAFFDRLDAGLLPDLTGPIEPGEDDAGAEHPAA
ncbi:type II toxin-antitoxin system VapB family antitoxin [Streptomyces sp. DSM 42041]|uniref:Type II toxin-antitoxin system VapB family antitoxin n=1 Tax=Streptomyces hazeniae TaxID=3075538 RepID=A0ABU2NKW1_9ACTN|nr:type II toxin-antitoxin system VapB family antitoxin [Streptomyces sp. DSM 42041]MDT0377624.1 type II toxin-antitoxin system VapB family antitoxin [Streptomyces sp. DSM 42041]